MLFFLPGVWGGLTGIRETRAFKEPQRVKTSVATKRGEMWDEYWDACVERLEVEEVSEKNRAVAREPALRLSNKERDGTYSMGPVTANSKD
ncbi:hypothetical protein BT69DRAFT_1276517, partial [Atractiella rhizophila]